ncbi:MAG: hypothetical protein BGP01_06185 [Paludibacter sp. 47-17]|nr:MAG: hypothetical protein BGP01_06185 [Paludibacter sp. 47-17]
MKQMITFLMLWVITASLQAQDLKPIQLNKPNLKRGSTVMQALNDRKSGNEFSDRMISDQDLSDLMWAANGINRPETGKRTAASAMNKQEVALYTFTNEGVHVYDAKGHRLTPVVAGDHRKLFGERGMAPLIILMVTDLSKFDNQAAASYKEEWGAIDTGIVSQNIALFCAANGISTRPRAFMNREGIIRLLKLNEWQRPMLNHAVGFAK